MRKTFPQNYRGSQRRFDSDPRLSCIFNDLRKQCSTSVACAAFLVVFLLFLLEGSDAAALGAAMFVVGVGAVLGNGSRQ